MNSLIFVWIKFSQYEIEDVICESFDEAVDVARKVLEEGAISVEFIK